MRFDMTVFAWQTIKPAIPDHDVVVSRMSGQQLVSLGCHLMALRSKYRDLSWKYLGRHIWTYIGEEKVAKNLARGDLGYKHATAILDIRTNVINSNLE